MAKLGNRPKVILPKLTSYEAVDPPKYDENAMGAKLWAKAAWFTGQYTNQELADQIDVSLKTLQLWVRGHNKRSGWLYEKEQYEKKAMKKVVRNSASRMDDILSQMLSVFESGIKEIRESNQKLNVGELSALANSFEKLFKARQLSIGAPTDIFLDGNGKSLTWNQIKKEIQDVDILDYSVDTVAKRTEFKTGHFLENKDS